MKKLYFTIILFSFIGVNLFAQDINDAFRIGEHRYYGTARSIGLNNAMTAIGGDLGSITINPAGSAVSRYSQFSVTPTFFSSNNNITYFPIAGNKEMTNRGSAKYSSSAMPNFGVTFNVNTGNKNGVVNVTGGIVVNAVNNYNNSFLTGGENTTSSIMGAFAAAANGLQKDFLDKYESYRLGKDWNSILAFRSSMISNYAGHKDKYIGTTESYIKNSLGEEIINLSGPIKQSFGEKTRGDKFQYILNGSVNISNKFYIGGNIGITSYQYDYEKYVREEAIDPSNFEIELKNGTKYHFLHGTYRDSFRETGVGFFGKFGFIFKPISGLRIGAAIQTPENISLNTSWQSQAEVHYDKAPTTSDKTFLGRDSYSFITPYRINAGIAYRYGKYAFISLDYEMADFGTMKFISFDDSRFGDTNKAIRNSFGIMHEIRTGLEIKPLPIFAIRGGYGYTTSPRFINDHKEYSKSSKNTYSFGIGYYSSRSLFLDFAARCTNYKKEYKAIYDDYVRDKEGKIKVYSPEVVLQRTLWDFCFTIGFRF